MAWFRCMVRGENFPIKVEGKAGPYGFYTTRFVEAADADAAEQRVVEMLRGDSTLAVLAGTPGAELARVYVEAIDAVDGPGQPNAGFAFYREEE